MERLGRQSPLGGGELLVTNSGESDIVVTGGGDIVVTRGDNGELVTITTTASGQQSMVTLSADDISRLSSAAGGGLTAEDVARLVQQPQQVQQDQLEHLSQLQHLSADGQSQEFTVVLGNVEVDQTPLQNQLQKNKECEYF